MTIAVWNSRFETGIDRIDQQHRALFRAVNDLAESFREGRSGEQVRRCLDFLAGYVQEHFTDEEYYMVEAGYPDLEAHRKEHQSLLGEVVALQDRLQRNETITLDVTIFLADWLTNHIEEADMGYVRFTRDRETD